MIDHLGQVPWFYLLVGAFVLFAVCAKLLYLFGEWRIRRDLKRWEATTGQKIAPETLSCSMDSSDVECGVVEIIEYYGSGGKETLTVGGGGGEVIEHYGNGRSGGTQGPTTKGGSDPAARNPRKEVVPDAWDSGPQPKTHKSRRALSPPPWR